jgi:hypothetical protein
MTQVIFRQQFDGGLTNVNGINLGESFNSLCSTSQSEAFSATHICTTVATLNGTRRMTTLISKTFNTRILDVIESFIELPTLILMWDYKRELE